MVSNNFPSPLLPLLNQAGLIGHSVKESELVLKKIEADGSMRRFWRVTFHGQSIGVMVMPEEKSAAGLAEARSVISIGRHLHEKNIPVPNILASDVSVGAILFEDCGAERLHNIVCQKNEFSQNEIGANYYKKVLYWLARMQVLGAEGFSTSWCYDTPRYDYKLRVEREAYYFLNEFWVALLGGERSPSVEEELCDIAKMAGEGDLQLFLHRDFQSRNIMVVSKELRFIDFQAGRLGPPGYDLASLLIDPYAALPEQLQELLYSYYLVELKRLIDIDENVFHRQYTYLSVQRNLQILGAFAFLSQKRKKKFFLQYLRPALSSLQAALQEKKMDSYLHLRALVSEAHKRISSVIVS